MIITRGNLVEEVICRVLGSPPLFLIVLAQGRIGIREVERRKCEAAQSQRGAHF